MTGTCNACRELIESTFNTRPHSNLACVGNSGEGELYRCTVCDSCFEFTAENIYLLDGAAAEAVRAAQTWPRQA